MPSLELLIDKFGPIKGRAEYNAYHREYRKKHRKKFSRYWKDRRNGQKTI